MKFSYGASNALSAAIFAIFAFAIIVGVSLGIFWLIWSLWTFVLGQVWPDGPVAIVKPDYWLFMGEWVLLGMIGGRIFGRNKEDN